MLVSIKQLSENDLKRNALKICLYGPQILNDFARELRKDGVVTQSDVLALLNILVTNRFLNKVQEKRSFPVEQGGGEYTVTLYLLTILGRQHTGG